MLLETGNYSGAAQLLDKAVQERDDDAKAYNCLGISLMNINSLNRAEKAFRSAIGITPDYEAAHCNLVTTLERLNHISEARTHLENVKGRFPDSVLFTLIDAVICRREGRFQEAINILETKPCAQDPITILKVKHELGVLYDRVGDVDVAFEKIKDFNQFATQIYGINDNVKAHYLSNIKKCQETFTPAWVKSWDDVVVEDGIKSPAFLLGFARSGTTLLQHILSSHPAIHSTEEIPAFHQVIERAANKIGPYPSVLANLNGQQIAQMRRLYYQIHQQDEQWQDTALLVDKYPMITNMAGAIHRIFPDAKFIFAQRHPCDCILSAYMQIFEPNEASVHFYNLDDLVTVYTRLMDLWQQYTDVLPLEVQYVRYEDIVADFEGTIRNVLSFLELPWDDAVLKYDENVKQKANVKTPSYAQVSEGIYDRAKYRWERYQSYLEPYMDRLKPYIERYGYEVVK